MRRLWAWVWGAVVVVSGCSQGESVIVYSGSGSAKASAASTGGGGEGTGAGSGVSGPSSTTTGAGGSGMLAAGRVKVKASGITGGKGYIFIGGVQVGSGLGELKQAKGLHCEQLDADPDAIEAELKNNLGDNPCQKLSMEPAIIAGGDYHAVAVILKPGPKMGDPPTLLQSTRARPSHVVNRLQLRA